MVFVVPRFLLAVSIHHVNISDSVFESNTLSTIFS